MMYNVTYPLLKQKNKKQFPTFLCKKKKQLLTFLCTDIPS